ncbi:DnaD domain protein [Fictibacillus sp. Mic-4]|uniref:replication initiation and membrane attachment family protein n=1 Tax=Fictibacillus sp. Mic-4 TaxID=3132826 RepID=UPI003CE8CEA5
MSIHWKEVVPVDTYVIQMNGLLHEYDRKVLTLLYQPLIGGFAYSLYMTFWCLAQTSVDEYTHQYLMNMTQFSLKDIIQARKKLEAIGLLKTYKREDATSRKYIYELHAPLSPHDFFNDGMLNVYLYNRLGKTKFVEMKEAFLLPDIKKEGFIDVTSSFSDVFTSLHPSEMVAGVYSEMNEGLGGTEGKVAKNAESSPPSIGMDEFDFDLLYANLSSFILPKEVITASIKEAIIKLAYVYQMEPLEMSKQVQNAYYANGELTVENLRKEVQKWYRIEHQNELPILAERTQPLKYRMMANKEPVSEEEKLIKFFEEISPYKLLELHEGGRPASSDLAIVSHLMLEKKMNPGVINVLLDYVLKTIDDKLPKAYIEKIASHWARKKVVTVKEAMELARKEFNTYKETQANKKRMSARGNQKRSKRLTALPDWLQEKDDDQQENPNDVNELTEEEKENQKWLEDLLKNF